MTLAAAGLAAVTVVTFLAPLWWAFDLFSHFRLQYVAVAVILGLVAIAVRARRTAVLLVAVALVHGWTIKDLWVGGAAAAASPGTPLRVVSANVFRLNETRKQVPAFIRSSDADVVVLTDTRYGRWRAELAALGELYPYRAPDRWRSGAPVVLFSRHPIVHHEVVHPPVDRRPYVVAELAVGDRRVTVVGVHLSSPSPVDARHSHWRNRQLEQIARSVDDIDQPVIVAGDFNTSPWSPGFRALLAGTGLRNAADGHGWIATWPTWFWPAQIPIDHVLTRGPIVAAALGRGPAIGSDHYPVIADLRLIAN